MISLLHAFLYLICLHLVPCTQGLRLPLRTKSSRDLVGLPHQIEPFEVESKAMIRESSTNVASTSQPQRTSISSHLGVLEDSASASRPSRALVPFHTYSIIGTPGMAPTRSTSAVTRLGDVPTTTEPAVSASASAAPRNNLSSGAGQWKVIGIGVSTVSAVLGVIFAVVFFDSWSAFLRDVLLGKRKAEGSEEFVPDWEKREWRYKLELEDGHRYPSVSSLSSISSTSEKKDEKVYEKDVLSTGLVTLPQLPDLPKPTYLPNYEPAS